jgi:rRNA maturation protein Nop10
MARSRLQKCTACGAYGLAETCGDCGSPAQAAGPMRFSPEDVRADLRRRLKDVESKAWAANLPSPDDVGEEE